MSLNSIDVPTGNVRSNSKPALFEFANCSSFIVEITKQGGAIPLMYKNGEYYPKQKVVVPEGCIFNSLSVDKSKDLYNTTMGWFSATDVKISESPSYNNTVEILKSIAAEEDWSYSYSETTLQNPILYNYLIHIFARIKDQDKIVTSGNYACFNTGLVTKNQEEIFMLFRKLAGTGDYIFQMFCKESSKEMTKFLDLPPRATFFTDPSELIYDSRIPLRIHIDHIVDDEENFNRFPEYIKKLPKLQLVNTFQGAVEHAKKRASRNYLTAVPQFYRGYIDGQLQLLLPLCLTNPLKADLALAIYKEDGLYSGRTCLTLDMAINNARLITKPDDEWLKP